MTDTPKKRKICPFHGENYHYKKGKHPVSSRLPPEGLCEQCWFEHARYIPLQEATDEHSDAPADR